MGIELPGSVRWVAERVVGENWPEGDETAMRRLADDWQHALGSLGTIIDDGDAAMQKSRQTIDGTAGDAMVAHWWEIESGDGGLRELLDDFEKLSNQLERSALEIEHAKLSIIGSLVALAVELIAAAAATPLTLGLSAAGGAAAEVATAAAIRMVIRKLILEILDEVVVNVIKDVAVEEFAQGVQIAKGDRHGWDVGEFAKTAGDAAINGVFAGGYGMAGDQIAEHLTSGVAKHLTEAAAGGVGDAYTDVATGLAPWNSDDEDGPSLRGAIDAGVTGFLTGAAERERHPGH